MPRFALLLTLLLSAPALGATSPASSGGTWPTQAASAARTDPWLTGEVLTRLFVLKPADGQRLAREVGLSPAQVAELRRMSGSERDYAKAARQVLGRGEAAALNEKLATMRAEKDRKAKAALGSKYPAFREWVRQWWAEQVSAARS